VDDGVKTTKKPRIATKKLLRPTHS